MWFGLVSKLTDLDVGSVVGFSIRFLVVVVVVVETLHGYRVRYSAFRWMMMMMAMMNKSRGNLTVRVREGKEEGGGTERLDQ